MKKTAAVVLLLVATATFAQQPKDVTLNDLSFIAGKWKLEAGNQVFEEHWSSAVGDNMMGMYRHMKDGKVKMYELLAIEQTPNGPVLRLKHFDLGLIGREEKAEVYNFPLVSFKPGEAGFERDNKEATLVFRKTPEGLTVILRKTVDGKPQEFPFTYKAF